MNRKRPRDLSGKKSGEMKNPNPKENPLKNFTIQRLCSWKLSLGRETEKQTFLLFLEFGPEKIRTIQIFVLETILP